MKLAFLTAAAAIAIYAGATMTSDRAPVLDESATAAYVPSVTISALRETMRKLWTDHSVYTHAYVVAAGSGAPETIPILNRLMRNQEDLGDAVGDFYGKPAKERMTQLLKQHIAQAGDLYKAMREGDKTKIETVHHAWHENGDAIADFLAAANPHWKKNDLRGMMSKHLEMVADQVKARMNKEWDADIKAYDSGYSHILEMSDALAEGIAKQFPTKVSVASK
jgi:hypothetical protein